MGVPRRFARVGVNLPISILLGGIQPPFPPIRRDTGRSLSPKGCAAFAPPNIGRVSEGRGGFGALRFPHAIPYPKAS
jgi:hypothetical protein